MIGGMVGIISRNGGMRGVVNLIAPLARTPARGQETPTRVSAAQLGNSAAIKVDHFDPLPSQRTNLLNIGTNDMLMNLQPSFDVLFHYVGGGLALRSKGTRDTAQPPHAPGR